MNQAQSNDNSRQKVVKKKSRSNDWIREVYKKHKEIKRQKNGQGRVDATKNPQKYKFKEKRTHEEIFR